MDSRLYLQTKEPRDEVFNETKDDSEDENHQSSFVIRLPSEEILLNPSSVEVEIGKYWKLFVASKLNICESQEFNFLFGIWDINHSWEKSAFIPVHLTLHSILKLQKVELSFYIQLYYFLREQQQQIQILRI